MEEKDVDNIYRSYSAINKTISDFGDKVNKANITIEKLDTKLGDFIDRIDKKIEEHDDSIKSQSNLIGDLDIAKTKIETSIKVTLYVVSALALIISGMGGYIITSWTNTFNSRLDAVNSSLSTIEKERQETLNKALQILSDKKNYLNINKEVLKDIFANL